MVSYGKKFFNCAIFLPFIVNDLSVLFYTAKTTKTAESKFCLLQEVFECRFKTT